ncbi:MAG: hypothetical protein IPG64_22915 [Haliea sp.]|nr:hypothetical protein [Haliea sp.]
MSSLITQRLITFARKEFRLDWDGIHGAPHWSRVRHNGLLLAEQTSPIPASLNTSPLSTTWEDAMMTMTRSTDSALPRLRRTLPVT